MVARHKAVAAEGVFEELLFLAGVDPLRYGPSARSGRGLGGGFCFGCGEFGFGGGFAEGVAAGDAGVAEIAEAARRRVIRSSARFRSMWLQARRAATSQRDFWMAS